MSSEMRLFKSGKVFFLFLNVVCGFFMLAASVLSPGLDWGSRLAAFTAFCFFLSGWGIYFHKRLLQLVSAVTVALILGITGLAMLGGSLLWGFSTSAVSNIAPLLFILVAFLEILSLFHSRRKSS
jgi:hypothetical protein